MHHTNSLFSIKRDATRRALRLGVACALTAAGTMIAAAPADAHVTKIQIITKESPTFGGYSWPGVGQYEKIVGKAFGELDPTDPKNAVIVDLQLAPRNASGRVEYSFDFYILKPIDLTKGNHKMLYEPPNRGGKTISALNRGVGGNDPGSVTDPMLLANAFLMPQGYSISFSGWDLSAGKRYGQFQYDHHVADRQEPGRVVHYRAVVPSTSSPGPLPTSSRIRPRRSINRRRR